MSDSNSTAKFCNICQCETERYASGKCKPCVKAYNKKWWNKNETYASIYRKEKPDVARSAQKKFRETHKAEIALKNKTAKEKYPEKFAAYSKKYYDQNRSTVLQKARDWKAKNSDRVKKYHSEWTALNLESVRIYAAKRRAMYPSLMRTYWQNRRSRKLANGGVLSVGLAAKLFKLQKGKCACCKKPLGSAYHMDHIMPLALGGSNADDNMQLLRARCNQQKSAKHPIDFMQQRGFLL